MINDKIFFDEKDPTGINYDTPFTVYGSYDGRLWSKTPAGTVKYYVQDDTKGKVLQVVTMVNSTNKDIKSAVYVDSNLSATITPSKQGTKIIVVVDQAASYQVSADVIRETFMNIVRDSTQIYEKRSRFNLLTSGVFVELSIDGSMHKVDTPTIPDPPVPITYKTQGRVNIINNETYIIFQRLDSDSTITLIEIE